MLIGFGNKQAKLVLHIANRPPLEEYQHNLFKPLITGEAADIIAKTGNHWRKIFSILAKIIYALGQQDARFQARYKTWQQYRDTDLLTDNCMAAITFEPYSAQANYFSIICGFSYAESQLDLASTISHQKFEKLKMTADKRCLVTPYFDWRQLNNEMLAVVINIVEANIKSSSHP